MVRLLGGGGGGGGAFLTILWKGVFEDLFLARWELVGQLLEEQSSGCLELPIINFTSLLLLTNLMQAERLKGV